jgi:hypothetical protein
MKIGIVFCAYNCSETLEYSLEHWIKAREFQLAGNQYLISAVSIPFAEYKDIDLPVDETPDLLSNYKNCNLIDYLFTEPKFIKESEARNLALAPLLKEDVDYIILWDGDEVITTSQIISILNFVKLDPFCSWFSISYKNFVFNKNTYLVSPFTPPRIFRVKTNGYTIDSFSWDNDILYNNQFYSNHYVDYKSLPTKVIPKTVAWVDHYTWLSNPKTRAKILYQQKHFNGVCSYRWNEAKNCVEFDPDFYSRRRLPIPEVATI